MTKCPTCGVDTETKSHENWCPNSGVYDENATLKRIMSTGWKCPGCGRIYAPITAECGACNEEINKRSEGKV